MSEPLSWDSPVFREYAPEECAEKGSYKGYPIPWFTAYQHGEDPVVPPIKDLVRELTGHRCIRCGHPYRTGESPPDWSPCDAQCTHRGPYRVTYDKGSRPEGYEGDTFYVDKDGAPAGYAFEAPPWPVIVEAKRRVLTVHHLTGHWGATGDAKRDCRWWNLVALCQRCHLQIQGKVQMDRPYLLTHSEWFRPYAAGWYAWKYESRYITRAEAEERMAELLAYEGGLTFG